MYSWRLTHNISELLDVVRSVYFTNWAYTKFRDNYDGGSFVLNFIGYRLWIILSYKDDLWNDQKHLYFHWMCSKEDSAAFDTDLKKYLK